MMRRIRSAWAEDGVVLEDGDELGGAMENWGRRGGGGGV